MQNPDAAIAEAIKAQSVSSEPQLETTVLKLPQDVLTYLKEAAEKRGVSTGDMARIALGTQKYLAEAVGNGAKVQLHTKSGVTDVGI